MTDYTIRPAEPADARAVGTLVATLLAELYDREVAPDAIDGSAEAAGRLLGEDGFAAILGFAEASPVAVLTLSLCKSVYAKGSFGEIAEFYVAPAHRSRRLGRRMVEAAIAYARRAGWPHLEVGAPHVPRWQRSVDFYQACGFTMVGPRLHLDTPPSGVSP